MPDAGDLRGEIEARIRIDLNKKLAAINDFLHEHSDACEKIDRIRDANEAEIRKEFQTREEKLKVSIDCGQKNKRKTANT